MKIFLIRLKYIDYLISPKGAARGGGEHGAMAPFDPNVLIK